MLSNLEIIGWEKFLWPYAESNLAVRDFTNSIISKLHSMLSYYVLIILYTRITFNFFDFMWIFIDWEQAENKLSKLSSKCGNSVVACMGISLTWLPLLKLKWRPEHLGALGIMGGMASLTPHWKLSKHLLTSRNLVKLWSLFLRRK